MAVAVIVSLAACVQGFALAQSPAAHPATNSGVLEFFSIAGLRVFAALALPGRWVMSWPAAVLAAIAVLGFASLISFAWRTPDRRPDRLLLLGALVAITAAALFKFNGYLGLLADPQNGDRYFLVPKILVLWLLVQAWDGSARWFTRCACLAVVLTTLTAIRFAPYVDHHWPLWAAKIRAGEAVKVPINPGDSTFFYRGKK
jgi:hypothetical protein